MLDIKKLRPLQQGWSGRSHRITDTAISNSRGGCAGSSSHVCIGRFQVPPTDAPISWRTKKRKAPDRPRLISRPSPGTQAVGRYSVALRRAITLTSISTGVHAMGLIFGLHERCLQTARPHSISAPKPYDTTCRPCWKSRTLHPRGHRLREWVSPRSNAAR